MKKAKKWEKRNGKSSSPAEFSTVLAVVSAKRIKSQLIKALDNLLKEAAEKLDKKTNKRKKKQK